MWFIHVLIFVTISKCQKNAKLTNIVIYVTTAGIWFSDTDYVWYQCLESVCWLWCGTVASRWEIGSTSSLSVMMWNCSMESDGKLVPLYNRQPAPKHRLCMVLVSRTGLSIVMWEDSIEVGNWSHIKTRQPVPKHRLFMVLVSRTNLSVVMWNCSIEVGNWSHITTSNRFPDLNT